MRGNPLSRWYCSIIMSHTHLHTYSPASSLAISKSVLQCPISITSRWAGLQAVLLLDGGEWKVSHYWLLPTSKILLLPWLQGELPKCVSVYLVELMELLAPLGVVLQKKKTPLLLLLLLWWKEQWACCTQITLYWWLQTSPHGSPLHTREDELDEGEAALQTISCMMDATLQSGGKQIKLNYPVDVQKVFFPPHTTYSTKCGFIPVICCSL